MKKRENRFLFFLFIFSFVIRACIFQFCLSKNNNYFRWDSARYHETATHIASGDGITRDDGSFDCWRMPGYSLFLALCYKLFGIKHVAALWIQVLLSSFIPLFIFLLSLALFPGNILLAKNNITIECCACRIYVVFWIDDVRDIVLSFLFAFFYFTMVTSFNNAIGVCVWLYNVNQTDRALFFTYHNFPYFFYSMVLVAQT